MLGALSSDTKVYIVTGRTDMRRSFDGLMAIIRDTYRMDPYMPDHKDDPAAVEMLLPWSSFIKEHCTGAD